MVFSNNLLLGASGQAAGGGGFDTSLIGNSIWNGESASNFFAKNFSGAGNSTTEGVFSYWYQKYSYGDTQNHWFEASGYGGIGTNSAFSNVMVLNSFDSASTQVIAKGTRVLRDSAWYHIIISIDMAQSTTEDKVKFFINGIQDTTINQQNLATTNGLQMLGSSRTDFRLFSPEGSNRRQGFAQFCYIDGKSIQQGDYAVTDFLDAYTFGTNGSEYGPKATDDITTLASDAGGNSFLLDFSSGSSLGNDASDNNNDWTPTNMSSTNQSSNTPSKSYALFSPLWKSNSSYTFTNNGNTVVNLASGGGILPLTKTITGSEKVYVEFVADDANNSEFGLGVADAEIAMAAAFRSTGIIGWENDGDKYTDGSQAATDIRSWADSAVLGLALDMGARKLWIRDSTGFQGSSGTDDPAAGSGGVSLPSSIGTEAYFIFGNSSSSADQDATLKTEANVALTYSIPTGFKTLNSGNVTAPSKQGADFFNAVTYAGNGTAIGSGGKAVTGANTNPGFVWIKNRSATDSHMLFDRIRTATKFIESDTTDAEATDAESLTTFGSDGFTVGNNAAVNTNSENYISWNWGTTAGSGSTTSPAGSLASTSLVADANHFSVVSYTGTGSATTTGHGLGGVAEMIMVKNRDAADGWRVYHSGVASDPQTDYMILNDTTAATDDNTVWNDTAPTSSVFSIGTADAVNTNTEKYIAYCFRSIGGVCKVGSFIGNGDNADGPVINTDFKPRFVMVKKSSATGNWLMYDTGRSSVNEVDDQLLANTNAAETTGSEELDILANGFKVRTDDSDINSSSATYVYLAMANIGGGGTLPPIYGH